MAALDSRGALWIPIEFSGYGSSEMDMPHCQSDFIPLGAFGVGVHVRANDGEEASVPPLRAARRARLYLGDFRIDGGNAYGLRLPRGIRLHRMPRGFGVGICAVNDAVDLVLRIRGRRRWARPGSQFAQWVSDSRPLAISLSDASAEPDIHRQVDGVSFDALRNQCD